MPISPRSQFRTFEGENGKLWEVEKISFGQFVVRPKPDSLIQVAKSCAAKLGVVIEGVSDHGRIWNTIWRSGKSSKGE
jgi:hypothetical protein